MIISYILPINTFEILFAYPEKCEKDVLSFDWFNKDKNKVELVRENRSTSVFVEDLETHIRREIDGWSM